jgi:1-deoxy-D-xylulose 5-phosphate reductoisomerase
MERKAPFEAADIAAADEIAAAEFLDQRHDFLAIFFELCRVGDVDIRD